MHKKESKLFKVNFGIECSKIFIPWYLHVASIIKREILRSGPPMNYLLFLLIILTTGVSLGENIFFLQKSRNFECPKFWDNEHFLLHLVRRRESKELLHAGETWKGVHSRSYCRGASAEGWATHVPSDTSADWYWKEHRPADLHKPSWDASTSCKTSKRTQAPVDGKRQAAPLVNCAQKQIWRIQRNHSAFQLWCH